VRIYSLVKSLFLKLFFLFVMYAFYLQVGDKLI